MKTREEFLDFLEIAPNSQGNIKELADCIKSTGDTESILREWLTDVVEGFFGRPNPKAFILIGGANDW